MARKIKVIARRESREALALRYLRLGQARGIDVNLTLLMLGMPKKKRKTEAHDAHKRARRLLFRHLTPIQAYNAEKNGWFDEKGNHTGRVYRIYTGKFLANIIDHYERKKYCICIPGRYDYPTCDHVLAQTLLLRTNERKFLSIANVTHY